MEDSQPVACALPSSSSGPAPSPPPVPSKHHLPPPSGTDRASIAGHALDLTSDEDLGIGIMNLISIEEHLFFTANKTGKPQYYEHLLEVREMRKELLKKIVVSFEGEVWCISKHLLASSMRLMEVGTKELTVHGVATAQPYFEKSYRLFRMFWEIVLQQPTAPADASTGANSGQMPVREAAPPEHRESATAPSTQEVLFFYEPTCPHCKALELFLTSNHLYERFRITRKDVTSDAANRAEIERLCKDCLTAAGEWEVPMVVHDGTCAMGEAAAMRLFRHLVWDGVKVLRQSVTAVVDQGDLPPHVRRHIENYSAAVDAALDCCKE